MCCDDRLNRQPIADTSPQPIWRACTIGFRLLPEACGQPLALSHRRLPHLRNLLVSATIGTIRASRSSPPCKMRWRTVPRTVLSIHLMGPRGGSPTKSARRQPTGSLRSHPPASGETAPGCFKSSGGRSIPMLPSLVREGEDEDQLAFFAAIHPSIFFSRIASGSAPVISTWAWKSRTSNLGPSSASALRRSRWMVIAPVL